MRLAGQSYASPVAAVGGLLGVQAENYAQASWAVSARTPNTTRQQLEELYNSGHILRTHVLRPTWHFVLPDDIRWLVDVTAPRMRRRVAQLQSELALDDATLDGSSEVIAGALSGGVHLTREAVAERLRDAGFAVQGRAVGVMLAHAEASALICSGVMEGNRHTFALLEERAPQARRLDRGEALAELTLRYFRGHGPATERDLAYWASLTLTDVRTGLDAVAGELDGLDHDGRTYWFSEPPPATDEPLEPLGHLLQTLDEYHNGYQDSRYTLDVDGIVPRGRRATVGMTLVDGQMVGDMRRTLGKDAATFEVGLFRKLADEEQEALRAAAQRYASWLELTPDLRLTAESG